MPRRPAVHRPLPPTRTREARPSRSKRGYTREWYRYRATYLADHPTCVWPGCSERATDVDHVEPVTGPDDPQFWDVTNHQGLCHGHHSVKTKTVDVGKGRAR